MPPILLGEHSVTLLRGRRDGLEVTLSPHDLADGFADLQARLTEQPSFYRGASAVVNFGAESPSADDLQRLAEILDGAGIALRGITGFDDGLESLAQSEGLTFESPRAELERRRAMRPREEVALSDAARSLVADFAGARDDIAQRRRRGEASVPRLAPDPPPGRSATALHVVEALPSTLYHAATLRGGQVLHHAGNIVVVGDVNPGAELIATGDILVFGRLGGHRARGCTGGRQRADLRAGPCADPASHRDFIAADAEPKRRSAPLPEAAVARDGRIIVLTLDRLGELEDSGVAST